MKTILEAIQTYPEQFISTLEARADTTPCTVNHNNHLLLCIYIDDENWCKLAEMLDASYYRKPLEGVITCLTRYSDMERETFWEIFELFEEGKIV